MSPYLLALCCGLTCLEMAAAVFAEKTGWVWIVSGVTMFVGLFFLYKLSLSAGSLTLVTIGWIFTSQIAAIAVDYFVFEKTATRNQIVGVVVILIGVAVMCIPSKSEGESHGLDHSHPQRSEQGMGAVWSVMGNDSIFYERPVQNVRNLSDARAVKNYSHTDRDPHSAA